MFNLLKKYLRKRKLKKYASNIDTGFMPLKDIHKVIILLDVEDPNYAIIQNDISYWATSNQLETNIFFLDFRKLGKNELLITSILTTIINKDINWYGLPDLVKVSPIINDNCDLFISLTDKNDFLNKFLSKCCKAKFKIGRVHMDESIYDIVISSIPDSASGHSTRKVFQTIKDILSKIE